MRGVGGARGLVIGFGEMATEFSSRVRMSYFRRLRAPVCVRVNTIVAVWVSYQRAAEVVILFRLVGLAVESLIDLSLASAES